MSTRHFIRIVIITVFAVSICRCAKSIVTNEPRPEIYWEFSDRNNPVAIEKVIVRFDGEDVSEYADTESWRISYRPLEPLAPGEHDAVIVIYDNFGKRAERAWKIVVDPDAPDTISPRVEFVEPSPAYGAVLNSGSGIAIAAEITDMGGSGVVEDTVSIRTFKDGYLNKEICNFPRYLDGKISCSLCRLHTGIYRIFISARDHAGNKSAEKELFFSVDSTKPSMVDFKLEPETVGPDDEIVVAANLYDIPPENLSQWFVRVLNPEGKTVKEFGAPAIEGENTLRFRGFEIEDNPRGSYRIKAYVEDSAGNMTESPFTADIVVRPGDVADKHPTGAGADKTGPEAIVPVPPDMPGPLPEPNIEPYAGSEHAAAGIFPDPTSWAGDTGDSNKLPEDDKSKYKTEKEIVILRTDAALPESSHEPSNDTAPPSIISISPRDGLTTDNMSPDISFGFEDIGGAGVDIASVRLVLDGEDHSEEIEIKKNSAIYRPPEPLAPGRHIAEAGVSDSIGNVASKKWSFTIAPRSIVDLSPPSVSFVYPPQNFITNNRVVMLKADLRDNVSVDMDSITLTLDMKDVSVDGLCVVDKKNKLICRLVLDEGKHRVSVSCSDDEGNRSSAALALTVDVTAPETIITSHFEGQKVAGDKIELSGRIYDMYGHPVKVTVDGLPAEVDANYWTVDKLPIKPGVNNIQIISKDSAGNIGESSITLYH